MNKEHYFVYLDNLRESGETNMFGAAPYLADVFELTKQEAHDILLQWMQTFDERHKTKH
jgi:hypothetical protein